MRLLFHQNLVIYLIKSNDHYLLHWSELGYSVPKFFGQVINRVEKISGFGQIG